MSFDAPAARVLSAQLAAELERVVAEATEIERLAAEITGSEPDATQIWALAGHLQAFYTGIEATLVRVLKETDGVVPSGPDSHREVLRQASLELPGLRPAIVDRPAVDLLGPYLAFRHFFRHAYGVTLRWDKMEDKVRGTGAARDAFGERLAAFRAFLDRVADLES